jgi:hypothetical protein
MSSITEVSTKVDSLVSKVKLVEDTLGAVVTKSDNISINLSKLKSEVELKFQNYDGHLTQVEAHRTLRDTKTQPNVINDFFVHVSQPSHNEPQNNLPQSESPFFISSASIPVLNISTLSTADTVKAWKKIKNPKSLTTDTSNICPKIIDLCMQSEHFQTNITNTFNQIISCKTVPDPLKKSRIIPIPKVPNPSSPNELRPIAIQPVLTKCFEKCLMPQLVDHFESNSLFCKEQFGFRKNHSTTDLLISVTDFIYETLDNNEICILVSLDFKKAFDKVDRSVLINKLKWYNVESELIQSLLSNRTQYVSCNCEGKDICSETKYTNLGVPQGACTSCLFFNVMINDLPDTIKNCKVRLFADDGNLLIRGPPPKVNLLKKLLEADLGRVFSWLISNRLEMNDEKVFFVIFSKPAVSNTLKDISIIMNGNSLRRMNYVKILGCYIDENMSWSEQLSSVNQKVFLSLSPLFPLSKLITLESRCILVRSLVLSKLYYSAVVWFNGSKAHLNAIDKLIRTCARYALDKRKYDSVSLEMTSTLKWLNCKYRIQFELLKFSFKIVYDICPDIFKNYLDLTPVPIRSTRSGTRVSNSITCNSTWGKRSFRYRASEVWINLPSYLKSVSSYPLFKKLVYDYLHDLQLEDLEIPETTNVCNLSCIDSVLNYDSYSDNA